MTADNFKRHCWKAALAVLGLVVGACGGSNEITTIAIVNTLSSLNPIVEAFQAQVEEGYDSEVEFVFLDPAAASFESGLDDLLANRPDLVVTLTTPGSLITGTKLAGQDIPQVFGMVTDPIGAGLVEDVARPGRNRTGVGLFHIEYTLELAVKATGAGKVGVIHQPSDAASVAGLDLAEKSAGFLGIELVVIEVAEDADLDAAMTGIPETGIDMFFVIGSPFTARNIGRISLISRTWSIPSVSALTVDSIPAGFMIGVAPDSSDLGGQMADRALAILHGGDAGEMNVGVSHNVALLDLDLARRYGITVPDDVLTAFDQVIGGTS